MGPSMADGNNDKLLREAIARNAAAVLTLPGEGSLRHCKSRLLASDSEGLWIKSDPSHETLIQGLIAQPAPVAVSFKSARQRLSFATTILRHDDQFHIDDSTVLPALLIEAPQQLQSVQRRADYRVSVSSEAELHVRAWRISDRADIRDQPTGRAELGVEVRDLSRGGMGVTFRSLQPKEPLRVVQGERLRIVLRFGKDELLLEGRVRHLPPVRLNEPVVGGVQFARLNQDVKGRQKQAALTRIVGALQRQEVRLMRRAMLRAG